jgi:hypothetical protein
MKLYLWIIIVDLNGGHEVREFMSVPLNAFVQPSSVS